MEPIECPECHNTFYYPEEEKQTVKVCWWCQHGIQLFRRFDGEVMQVADG